MNSVEIKGLTKRYSDFLLDNISFNVPTGSIVGLIGENGAGKSTTINALLGASTYDEGEISIFGKSNRLPCFVEAKQEIGAVVDGAGFPENFTVKDVEIILKNTYKNFDRALFKSYTDAFALPDKKKLKEYSKGMLMKLGIASAISHRPKLLVLDEATSGLDPLARDNILDILNEYTRDEKNAVLISSHIVSDLEKVCDYIVFMHKGKVAIDEEKDVLMERYAVLKVSDTEGLAKEAIVKEKRTEYGYELLVLKDEIPSGFETEITTLEDIIIFLSK